MNEQENFVDRIDLLLSERNEKRPSFCEKVGILPPQISMWKKRNSIPPADTLLRIAKYLNADPGWLLTGENFYTNTNLTHAEKNEEYRKGYIAGINHIKDIIESRLNDIEKNAE